MPTTRPLVAFRDIQVERLLRRATEADSSLGLRARQTLARYFDALPREQSQLGLLLDDWAVIKAATITRSFGDTGPYYLWADVSTFVVSEIANGRGALYPQERVASLVMRLQHLTPLQEVAVIELLEGERVTTGTALLVEQPQ